MELLVFNPHSVKVSAVGWVWTAVLFVTKHYIYRCCSLTVV